METEQIRYMMQKPVYSSGMTYCRIYTPKDLARTNRTGMAIMY